MKKWLSERKWVVGIAISCLAAASIVFIPRPSFEKRLLTSGKMNQENKNLKEAIDDYIRVVKYAPESNEALEAARAGAEISLYELKDYNVAIFFFRHIVRQSQRRAEVHWAQETLAETYYEKLTNYPQAIMEYQRLLEGGHTGPEYSGYRLKLAPSYYYMGNFDQAILEANDFLAKQPGDPLAFDMYMLKANSLSAQKKTDEAMAIYKFVEAKFPNHPQVYEAKMSKSLVFEDRKDWEHAIQELTEIKDKYPQPDVIALKIKAIEHRRMRKKNE